MTAGVVAIVYILAVMWIIQDEVVGMGGRGAIAAGFFYCVLAVYHLTDDKK